MIASVEVTLDVAAIAATLVAVLSSLAAWWHARGARKHVERHMRSELSARLRQLSPVEHRGPPASRKPAPRHKPKDQDT